MQDRKRQIIRYAFYDQTAMQKHFQKMASEGWLIEKINSCFLQFRRIEPQKLHIIRQIKPDENTITTMTSVLDGM